MNLPYILNFFDATFDFSFSFALQIVYLAVTGPIWYVDFEFRCDSLEFASLRRLSVIHDSCDILLLFFLFQNFVTFQYLYCIVFSKVHLEGSDGGSCCRPRPPPSNSLIFTYWSEDMRSAELAFSLSGLGLCPVNMFDYILLRLLIISLSKCKFYYLLSLSSFLFYCSFFEELLFVELLLSP